MLCTEEKKTKLKAFSLQPSYESRLQCLPAFYKDLGFFFSGVSGMYFSPRELKDLCTGSSTLKSIL